MIPLRKHLFFNRMEKPGGKNRFLQWIEGKCYTPVEPEVILLKQFLTLHSHLLFLFIIESIIWDSIFFSLGLHA